MATLAEKLHQEGRQIGLVAAIRDALSIRFGKDGLVLMPQIESIADPERLEALHRRILEVNDLEALRALL